MRSFFKNASIQTQINAALGLIGLCCVGSLLVATMSADSTQKTFEELDSQRVPAIFAAFDANDHLAKLNMGFDRLAAARSNDNLTTADRIIATATEELRVKLGEMAGGRAGNAVKSRIDAVTAARKAAAGAANARLLSASEIDVLWRRTETLQKQAAAALVSHADEATFDLVMNAEDAKTRLEQGLAKLLNNDLNNLTLLMRLRAVLAEIEGAFYTADVAVDSGVRAAALDRLESALGRLREEQAAAPAALKDDLEALGNLTALAVDPARSSVFFAQNGASRAFTLKGRIAKAVADQIDEASFNLVLAGEDLSANTLSEVDKLANATTGEYRATLDATALAQSVASRVAQAINAPDRQALALVRDATATLKGQLESATTNASLAAFSNQFKSLSGLLADDGGVFGARAQEFAAIAATEKAQQLAMKARQDIGSLVAERVAAERQRMLSTMGSANDMVGWSRNVQLAAGLVTLLVVALVAVAFIRPRIVAPLRAFREAVAKLAQGEQVDLPGAERGDEIGALARSMGVIYDNGRAAARIRLSLDNSSALLVIADAENNISYVSAGLADLFAQRAAEIRADLPDFDAKRLIGAGLSQFNVTGEARGLCGTADHVLREQMALGGRRFELVISPLRFQGGERLGTVVEWRDATAEIRATKEIDQVVSAALQGDFSKRAELEDAPEVLREMGDKLNQVAEAVNASVTETNRVMTSIAGGDLSEQMSGDFRGVFAELQSAVNQTVEHLAQLIGDISRTAETVRSEATEITAGAEDLSSRAEQQAASLEETAATMEEMSTSIKSNAGNSSSAQTLAAGASGEAKSGGQIVRNAVSAMSEIETGAAKIVDIISVIDGIAFQTNLLALNAAVEAARAGDAGKGFAVVASEVRALAQRSSEAAHDIRGLIETSAAQVSDGVRLVTETGDALEGIVASISQVEDSIRNIAEASGEQASSVEEMSTTVSHMDDMTQQNASLAERSATNARSLSDSAKTLQELIAFFKVAHAPMHETQDEEMRDQQWRSTAPTAVAEQTSPSAPATRDAPDGDWASF